MKLKRSVRNSQSVRPHLFSYPPSLILFCYTVKEKYGSDVDENEDDLDDDSEENESEDEDGEELTPALDAAILRTLAKIKRKDPSIYDHSKSVFQGPPHSLT